MLSWARETAGLSAEEAAGRFSFTRPSKNKTAREKLLDIENGRKFPTRKQLLIFAAAYRRSLVVFYLKEPPSESNYGEDFRQTQGDSSQKEKALLKVLLRDISIRQQMVKVLLEDENDIPELTYVGSASTQQPVQSVASSIATTIGFDYQNFGTRKGLSDADALFEKLRQKAETVGIFVMLAGDLGSHHTRISPEMFRGFTICDKISPFVVINDQDAKAARSFTLIHELAHIWLDQPGVSGQPTTNTPTSLHSRIERFCNDVAGEFLLPDCALNSYPIEHEKESVSAVVEDIADRWLVSESMTAYRLNRTGKISTTIYRKLASEYSLRWQQRQTTIRKQNQSREGGPNPWTVKRHRLGNPLVEITHRSLRDNNLTHTKAAKILGVKPGSVERFLQYCEEKRY